MRICALVLLLLLSAVSAPLSAQVTLNGELLPPCKSQSEDLDGDGIGYTVSFNYDRTFEPGISYTLDGSNCLVTVESEPPPNITNLTTGTPVTLQRINWSVDDLVGKPIECQVHEYDESAGEYIPRPWKHNQISTLGDYGLIPYMGTVRLAFQRIGEEPLSGWEEGWFIEDGKYYGGGALQRSTYAQFVGGTMRIWANDQRDYTACNYQSSSESLRPNSRPPTQNITDLYYVECVDTFPLGNGWGWDGHRSCSYQENGDNFRYVTPEYAGELPLQTSRSNCSYVDALQYDGWGWNAVTGQSCPPKDNSTQVTQTSECIDTDGDGWGWDGVKSCVVSAPVDDCSYSDADMHDGWGWNPVTSKSCSPRL